MESIFISFADRAGLLVEGAAVLIVVFGAAEAFARLVWTVWARTATHRQRKEIWRRFGVWLLLGLEFELAADIIGSVISPTWEDIGELAAIAAIRTFLNYFLEKDLERAEVTGESETPRRIAPVTG